MRANYSQIFSKTAQISATADAIKTYGRARETAYQLAKQYKELKRDVEHNLVGQSQNAALGDATSVARRWGSVFGQDANSNSLIHADVTFDGGSTDLRALTESIVLSAHQTLYEEGAEPDYMLITPAHAQVVSNFAYAAAGNYQRDLGTGKKIVNAVDVYVSPYGELKVVLDRFLKAYNAVGPVAAEILLFEGSMWELSTLRGWTRTTMAKTGDSTKHFIVGEFGLKHKNYRATGRITNLNNS